VLIAMSGKSNKQQADAVRKKAKGSEKVVTDEDVDFKKQQAEQKKKEAAAAKALMGKKK